LPPGYEALTTTVGGTDLWILRDRELKKASAPRSVITMRTTEAKTGRSTKKRGQFRRDEPRERRRR
jgi:hypothetical protein